MRTMYVAMSLFWLATLNVPASEPTPVAHTIPIEIVVEKNGIPKLKTESRDAAVAIETLPAYIPVFTELEDGTRVPGVIFQQTGSQAASKKWPSRVALQANGDWSISYSYFVGACGKLRPGAKLTIPGSERARIAGAAGGPAAKKAMQNNSGDRSSLTINTYYNHFGAADQLTENDVRLAMPML